MMRNALLAVLVLVVIALAVIEYQRIYAPATASRSFVGSWRLVSSVELLPDGTSRPYAFGPRAQGYLIYDAGGHVCAEVADPDRPKWADPEHPTAQELKSAYEGFGGYCGVYTVDERVHTTTHIPEVSFDPNLIAQPKPRSYRFENERLIYSGSERIAPGGESHWTMIWEKMK